MNLQSVWASVKEKVKERVTGRSMWQAIDSLIPLAIEDNQAIFGIESQHLNLLGHVRQQSTKLIITNLLSSTLQQKVEVIIFEGSNAQDWELYKRKQEEARKLTEAQYQRKPVEHKSADSWEALYEQVGRRFADTPGRSLAQNRARYLQEVLQVVREAIANLTLEDEQDERQFNRIVERIANNVEVPSTIIAWMILYGQGTE